jgi:hypothetical protein
VCEAAHGPVPRPAVADGTWLKPAVPRRLHKRPAASV